MSSESELNGVIPKDPFIHNAVEFLTQIFIPKIYVLGLENIDKLKELLDNKNPVILMPNHLSNADGPIIDQAFRRSGFTDIAERLIYIKGKKLDNNPVTEFLTHAFPTIVVWPTSLTPLNNDEEKEAGKINRQALHTAKKALEERYHLVLFPEGGRSRTKELIEPVPQTVGYLNRVDNTFVVPVGIIGSEKVLPVGEIFPSREPVSVNFGRPINVSLLEKILLEELSKDEALQKNRKLLKSTLRGKTLIYIMEEIRDLLPDQYHGIFKGRYEVPFRLSS